MPPSHTAILLLLTRSFLSATTPLVDDLLIYVTRCEPVEYCAYRYRFLDATLGESCRLKGEVKIVRPIYKSKIMGHPVRLPPGPP